MAESTTGRRGLSIFSSIKYERFHNEFVVFFAQQHIEQTVEHPNAKETRRRPPNMLAYRSLMFNIFIFSLITPLCMQYAMLSFPLSHPYNPNKSFVHY